MRLWLSCMVLLCAAFTIDCQEKTDYKIKTLKANDDADDNSQDTLTIMVEGELSDELCSSGSFRLQIKLIPDDLRITPIKRELEAIGATATDKPKGFSVVFPYKTNDGLTNIITEILNQNLGLELIINESGGTLVASSEINANLKDVSAFPSSSDIHFVSDTENPTTKRWLRVGVEAKRSEIITCQSPPCYTYEDPFVNDATYSSCVDVTVTAEQISLCSSDESKPTDITSKDDEVLEQIILDHAGNLEVKVGKKKTAKNIDLVVHKSTDLATLKTCTEDLPTIVLKPEVKCALPTIASDTEEYKILLVGYDGPTIIWTNDYTSNNHDLTATFLSTDLIEVSLDHKGNAAIQQYYVTLNKKDANDLDAEAYVDCSAVADKCFSYFVGVPDPSGGTYQVTIQDITKFNGGVNPEMNEVSIRTDVPPLMTSLEKKIVIHDETIETKVIDMKMIVEVCFDQVKNISMRDTHYEFLVVNSKGQWKKETVVTAKSDFHACFHSVELAFDNFKENSKAFVLLRNTQYGNVLASGEVKILVPDSALDHTGDTMGNTSDNTVWIIVGTSAGILTCLVLLVALIHTKFIRRSENDDGIQYPFHRDNIDNSNINLGSSTIIGLDNPVSTM